MKIIKENKLKETKYVFNKKLFTNLDNFIDKNSDLFDQESADQYLGEMAELFGSYLNYAFENQKDNTTSHTTTAYLLNVVRNSLL